MAETTVLPPDASLLWPQGGATQLDPKLQGVLARDDLAGPGMRAMVVIRDGRLVAERYATGFGPQTPLLGWSMTKTVNAALLGIALGDGALKLDGSHLFPQWQNDARSSIKVSDLLAMEDGLEFNEDYGDVSDVTRMLYLEPDMLSFMIKRPAIAAPGTVFNYSTGSPVLLSRLWMNHAGDPAKALRFPREALFAPVGMDSAVSKWTPLAPSSVAPISMQQRGIGRGLACFWRRMVFGMAPAFCRRLYGADGHTKQDVRRTVFQGSGMASQGTGWSGDSRRLVPPGGA